MSKIRYIFIIFLCSAVVASAQSSEIFKTISDVSSGRARDYQLCQNRFFENVGVENVIWYSTEKGTPGQIDCLGKFFNSKDGEAMAAVSITREYFWWTKEDHWDFDIGREMSGSLNGLNISADMLTTVIDDPSLLKKTRADSVIFYVFPCSMRLQCDDKSIDINSQIQEKYPHCCGIVLRHSNGDGDVCLKLFLSDKAFREREKYVKQAASMIRFKKKSGKNHQ